MVKFEVVYSGAETKISLSDGRKLRLKDGDKILIPEEDWNNTFSNSENFKLFVAEKPKAGKSKVEKPKRKKKKGGK